MLWHGSKKLFSRFSLADAGRLTGATNGALGIWCSFEGDRDLAGRFAGDNGALYGIREPEGTVHAMGIGELARLHEEAGDLGSVEEEIAFYDGIRTDLLARGHGRVDIVENDGTHSMCIVLDPEAIIIEVRDIRIIPHDRLPEAAGISSGELISDEAFREFHAGNRIRIIEALDRHICKMGVEDRAADGSRNFSKRVGEQNERRKPFRDALTRLSAMHEEIWREDLEKLCIEMEEVEDVLEEDEHEMDLAEP